jgi:hypothetical protein
VIRNGLAEVTLAFPLIAAIAVNDGEVVPVKSAGVKRTRASIDCNVAGPFYANLAIVCGRGNNEENGDHADQSATSPFSRVFCDTH